MPKKSDPYERLQTRRAQSKIEAQRLKTQISRLVGFLKDEQLSITQLTEMIDNTDIFISLTERKHRGFTN